MNASDGENPFAEPPDSKSASSRPPSSDTEPGSPFNAYTAPQTVPVAHVSGQGSSDGVSKLIPYKNPPALIAYYLGILSLLPCLGLLAAIPALILGIIGLKRRSAHPEIAGSVHAWIGIVLGGIFMLIWGAAIILLLVTSLFRAA